MRFQPRFFSCSHTHSAMIFVFSPSVLFAYPSVHLLAYLIVLSQWIVLLALYFFALESTAHIGSHSTAICRQSSMAHQQQSNSSAYIEIQSLMLQLDSSWKEVDRYSCLGMVQLLLELSSCVIVVTLSRDLDELRVNICHTCKMKFVLGSVLDPAVAAVPLSRSSGSFRASSSWPHRQQQSFTSPTFTPTLNGSSLLPVVPTALALNPATYLPTFTSAYTDPCQCRQEETRSLGSS